MSQGSWEEKKQDILFANFKFIVSHHYLKPSDDDIKGGKDSNPEKDGDKNKGNITSKKSDHSAEEERRNSFYQYSFLNLTFNLPNDIMY